MQCCLSFSKTNEGNFKTKIVWEVDLEPLLVEERNRGNKGIEQIEE